MNSPSVIIDGVLAEFSMSPATTISTTTAILGGCPLPLPLLSHPPGFDIDHLAVYCGSCLAFLRHAESERKKRLFFCKECMHDRRRDANAKKNERKKNEKQLMKCGIILSGVRNDTAGLPCGIRRNVEEVAKITLNLEGVVTFSSQKKRSALDSVTAFPMLSAKKERKNGKIIRFFFMKVI